MAIPILEGMSEHSAMRWNGKNSLDDGILVVGSFGIVVGGWGIGGQTTNDVVVLHNGPLVVA